MFNIKTKKRGPLTTSTSLTASITRCSHCGRTMNNFAGGYSRGRNGELLCHPNVRNRPNCYKLVTNYDHVTPCVSTRCYEEHPNFTDYIRIRKPRKAMVK